jgi:hypothetical protein
VVLNQVGTRTQLLRYDALKKQKEELSIDGQVLAVAVDGGNNYLVIKKAAQIEIVRYVPSDDSDGDGVPNWLDKFPHDKSAAVDSDNDGYPDAFLNGMTAADSSTGLTLDYYPSDANCHALDQGDGVKCKVVMPAFTPDIVIGDDHDMVYLLSRVNHRVYRWSKKSGTYLSPYVVGSLPGGQGLSPVRMALSLEHQRLYLGYESGVISYVNLSGDAVETSFTAVARAVGGLASAGNFLLAQDESGAWNTHYLFDKQGKLTDSKEWNYYSRYYTWNALQSRLYFFRDDTSPNDLLFEVIDQASGKITAADDSPYHGAYRIAGPIRVSVGGGRIVLGSGDVYSTSDLTVVKSLGASFTDAQWLDSGVLWTMSAIGKDTQLSRYDASLVFAGQQTVAGKPVALLRLGAGVLVITQSQDQASLNFLSM